MPSASGLYACAASDTDVLPSASTAASKPANSRDDLFFVFFILILPFIISNADLLIVKKSD
jgi:hypothetical protein